MLDSTKRRLRQHSRTVAVTVGVAGGLYLAGQYAVERLRDMQDRAAEERRARESLRRRFIQNQEDCTFTLLALLPTLSAQILTELDVERPTHELQQLSRQNPSSLRIPPSEQVDLGESVVSLANSSAGSEGSKAEGPSAPESTSGRTDDEVEAESRKSPQHVPALMQDSSHESWTEEFKKREGASVGSVEMDSSTQSLQSETSGYLVSEPSESASSPEHVAHADLPMTSAPAPPAATVTIDSPAPTGAEPAAAPEKPSKTKMQLWNELKLLTFTRSLTTVYTIVLLSLHTRVQLNILGRYSYIRSVRELEESLHPTSGGVGEPSTVSSWLSYLAGAVGAVSLSAAEDPPKARGGLEDEIDQETEMAYLTFSWWLMNIGWREVKERVALAVEEVLGPVSLKKVIDQTDLETLLSEVRRKVEWDLGGDGIPRPHSFIPHMLPTTAAQEAQLLGSLNLSPPYTSSIPSGSPLRALLVETTSALSSVDFGYALDGSLACAFGALGVHLSQKGLLGGEVVGGDGGGGASGPVAAEEQPPVLPRAKGRKLAEVLVEVSRWGRDCLTADQGGLGRNDIIDSLAELPALGAFSATIYSAYDDLLENDFF